jgi:Ca2+-binding EF-hand superfamily protein|mmetsp:Transcript_63981/g.105623  ORF Transcript_63981/g.105623 Transcript_63981/m.105623 type:complete len:560 (+) Transcript_63981:74-1753(+)|eukprot:CAMPEP_0174298090 /NCGR_PEP_ID=MMETSP0809-20121228/52782_1 /TAXON_ID=73025 ORGANISM="Eutreptiella gymnastica-like, Strain CCMP1594" /NCGR_SAMPLE_ID=MMETSP0809 /ASSEMBLY_ACC=CAM_ASM_000658 /LENGTH=559 /DNA_ID=CAMNT_0015402311 /DNA_START=74 /DNA_END=1753 /DNA_ORIENTATION=-
MTRLKVQDVQYIRQHQIPALFNDMALHVMHLRPDDPVNELLQYLQLRYDTQRAPAAQEAAPGPSMEDSDVDIMPPPQRSRSLSFSTLGVDKLAAVPTSRRASAPAIIELSPEDQQKRRKVWRSFFNHWDLDANGYIDYEELRQMILSLQELSSKDARKILFRLKSELLTRGMGTHLQRSDYEELMMRMSNTLDRPAFEAVAQRLAELNTQLCAVADGDQTRKQVIWSLFQDWDLDDDGCIDYEELEKVISGVKAMHDNKFIRKERKKWQAKIAEESRWTGESALTINQFHLFLANVFGRISDKEFEPYVQQIRERIASLKRQGPPSADPHLASTSMSLNSTQFGSTQSVAEERPVSPAYEDSQWNKFFSMWDLDGSGYLDLPELEQVMSKLDETKSKQCKKAFVQMKTGLQTNGKRDQLSRKDFVQFMISIEQSLKQSEIQKFKEKLEEALDEVICETQGSEKKRALWDLFCSWDADSNGYLDWNELQKVVADVGALDNKRARRSSAAWKCKLSQSENADQRMNLAEFHDFFGEMMGGMDDKTFFDLVNEMKTKACVAA